MAAVRTNLIMTLKYKNFFRFLQSPLLLSSLILMNFLVRLYCYERYLSVFTSRLGNRFRKILRFVEFPWGGIFPSFQTVYIAYISWGSEIIFRKANLLIL